MLNIVFDRIFCVFHNSHFWYVNMVQNSKCQQNYSNKIHNKIKYYIYSILILLLFFFSKYSI